MSTSYKTSAQDAQAMAKSWYAMAGVANPTPKALAWWTKQIQQDGSHTAFLNFQSGKGQDQADAFDPQRLASAVSQIKQSSGLDPWQPNAQTPQLDGTNTKNLSGIANQNPVLAGLVGASFGNPLIGAGAANASHSGATGTDFLKGGLEAAAVAAPIAGALSGGSLLGGASKAAGALPGIAALGSGGGSNSGGGGSDITSLLSGFGTTIPAVLEGVNAANLQSKANDYATGALKTQTDLWDSQAPLRSAGLAGMLNPSTPAPGMPEIQALRGIASTGNPFAPKPGLPTPAPVGGIGTQPPPALPGKPEPPTGLPTPAPIQPPSSTNQLQPSY